MLARGARMSDTSYLVLCAYTLMHTRITMCVISPRHARLALGHCWHWLALALALALTVHLIFCVKART